MAVFIIAIIAVLIAAFIAGVIIRTLMISAVDSGITFNATSTGALIKKRRGFGPGASFLTMLIPTRFRSNRLGNPSRGNHTGSRHFDLVRPFGRFAPRTQHAIQSSCC